MAFRWCADDGLTLNVGLVDLMVSGPVLIRNPIFYDFSWVGVQTPCPHSGFAHEHIKERIKFKSKANSLLSFSTQDNWKTRKDTKKHITNPVQNWDFKAA